MSAKLTVFLTVALGWAALAGLAIWLSGVELGSVLGIAMIAVLYMPSPLVAAVVAERGLVRARFALPDRRTVGRYLLLPVVAIVGFALLYLGVTYLGGAVLDIDALGSLVTTSEALADAAADLLGQTTTAQDQPLPPLPILLLASLWGAVVAGWTVNGVAAMGEEYGWRGLMWDELKAHGPVRANVVTGLAWGLWHAPLIVQGYNYPDHPLLGVLAMTVFCVGMSPLLSAIRERTSSVIPVAAAHGIFNAFAAVLLLVTPDANPLVVGPLGALGAVLLGLVGVLLWRPLRAVGPTAPAGSARRA